MERFRSFLLNFTLPPPPRREEEEEDEEDMEDAAPRVPEPVYKRHLQEIHDTQVLHLAIDLKHLHSYLPCRQVYSQLVRYPQEMVPIMDLVVHEEYTKMFPNDDLGPRRIQVRTFHMRRVHALRDLGPAHIDQMVAVRGMVTRASPIIPDLKQAFFRCIVCNGTKEVLIDRGRIDEPSMCDECQAKGTMTMVHNMSLFTDKQMVRLQETPDEIPEGETPHTVTLFTFDDLVDSVRPGDRVEVTGVYRAVAKRANPKMRVVRSVFKTYVDVLHFRLTDAKIRKTEGDNAGDATEQERQAQAEADADGGGVTLDGAVASFSKEKIEQFKAMAADPHVYDKLTQAIAPSIWEMDDVKRGCLCQMFGGNDKAAPPPPTAGEAPHLGEGERAGDGAGSTRGNRRRGELNVLLCGDPGTSKSQLLSFVHKIAPRGIYTSGRGSSAVGLTASVIRDPETRDLVLESGALVLSDNGICCIDEFDKMSDTTRAVLHEAMEQQTVSIAKAGIICTLNARTAILASANPVESRYNPRLSVIENIRLPPTLLSRFDLIYLVLDKPNADTDRRLARHLVGLYFEKPVIPEAPMSQDFLRDYIAFARKNIHPLISEPAVVDLIKGYLDMRRLGGRGSKTITATPRQLESLIRLSEALARMRHSHHVERSDVAEAIRLMRVSTQSAATDPRTGTIDMDMINTGRTAVDREAIQVLAKEVKLFLAASSKGRRLGMKELRRSMNDQSDVEVSNADLVEAVRVLADDGAVQFNEGLQTVLMK